MAAVRSLRVSVKSEGAPERSESSSGSEGEREPEPEPEPEPMEVEEGELESIPVRRSLKELIPADCGQSYQLWVSKYFVLIDLKQNEAVEKKEQRAKRFHFRAEVNLAQRNVVLDREMMKKAIPKVRFEALTICGVDEMSTRDVFDYFKEYPPAHIEWLDDTSCNVVWLDEVTATRVLLNMSAMPDLGKVTAKEDNEKRISDNNSVKKDQEQDSSDNETEEGEVEDDNPSDAEESDTLSQAEEESLLRNDLRPSIKLVKGNKLFMRFATKDDKKELGAARRSQYYMKYGNPNYGGMKGILSNSWKRRYHSRRIQRDVLKKRSFISEDVGLTPPYKHLHSDLINVPEEPIEEEEEEEEDEDQDMDEDDRVVVEYRDDRPTLRHSRDRGSARHSCASDSGSDEMDYDLELKMISTPSPKKSMKMTMYADEVESKLKSIRGSPQSISIYAANVKELNQLSRSRFSQAKHLVKAELGYCPFKWGGGAKLIMLLQGGEGPGLGGGRFQEKNLEKKNTFFSPSLSLSVPSPRETGFASEFLYKTTGSLWSRLGSAPTQKEKTSDKTKDSDSSSEADDTELQRAWGAMIKEKEQSRKKKSRLDNLPSLQIEISRESSSGSDSES
uniref:Nuclear cap-binding protein subunit 3 n=1 Tax=Latimeria chalumnae TaxID=7897 RepID=H3BHL7_LATCH